MITYDGKVITTIFLNEPFNLKSHISTIYKGSNLIWATAYEISVKSCYGSGVWLDTYNWVEDQWKNL